MTTPPPPLLPGRPSDKLIQPLNAPKAAAISPGVQPGASSGVTLAQYVVVFGDAGGVFIYVGAPGPGNAPVYWVGNVTADPYGNPLDEGIWAGQPGSIQVGIQTTGAGPTGSASIFFVPVGTYQADAAVGLAQTSTQAILEIAGAQTAAAPAANSDHVVLGLWDHGTSGDPGATAAFTGFYFDANGGANALFDGNCIGMSLYSVAQFAVTDPNSGADSQHPFQPETWHQATLKNSWTGTGAPGGIVYRLVLPDLVEIMGDIVGPSGVTGNSVAATISDTSYQPAASQNHPAAWNNPVASNSASAPWVNYQTNGNIQITGIESAGKEVFFHLFIPLGTL